MSVAGMLGLPAHWSPHVSARAPRDLYRKLCSGRKNFGRRAADAARRRALVSRVRHQWRAASPNPALCDPGAMGNVKTEVISLSEHVFERTIRRLDGLSDVEYLWEPVPNCCTIRARSEGG